MLNWSINKGEFTLEKFGFMYYIPYSSQSETSIKICRAYTLPRNLIGSFAHMVIMQSGYKLLDSFQRIYKYRRYKKMDIFPNTQQETEDSLCYII